MYLAYLIKNRSKTSVFSSLFYKKVIKRIIHFYALMRLELSRLKLIKAGSRIGDLSIVSNHCKLNGKREHLTIGNNVFIGNATLNLHGNINVGDNTVINDGANIITASHDVDCANWTQFAKDTQIGKFVWIATGATILPGVSIADYAVIGAGAVVSKSVNEGEIVAGNPAKVVRQRKLTEFTYSPVRFIAPFDAWLN